MTQTERAQQFGRLHETGTFVLANAWDAASAAVIADSGAQAVATTSSGISWSLGVPDGENLTRLQAVEAIGRIASAVTVPVSADIEAGYGPTRADVTDSVAAVIEAGAVGANVEDRRRDDDDPLWAVDEQSERLAAAREVADRLLGGFILNARTDVYLAGVGEPARRPEMVLERAQAFAQAGADCLFVPGLNDLAAIRALAAASPLPLNVLLAPGSGPRIGELADAGVRRISVGHLLAANAYAALQTATVGLLAADAEPLAEVIPYPRMQALMGGGRPVGARVAS
jgi:2-methylisocitrate lyase-like PEP mutase family enzyme